MAGRGRVIGQRQRLDHAFELAHGNSAEFDDLADFFEQRIDAGVSVDALHDLVVMCPVAEPCEAKKYCIVACVNGLGHAQQAVLRNKVDRGEGLVVECAVLDVDRSRGPLDTEEVVDLVRSDSIDVNDRVHGTIIACERGAHILGLGRFGARLRCRNGWRDAS